MSKKLPANGFKWLDSDKINEDFIKNYDENNDKGYILEVDVKCPKRLHELHSDLFKCKKLVSNLFNKKNLSHT